MDLDQIKRKGEKWCRKIYNIIKQTKNLVNIATATGKELDIVDTDKYTYIMSYSFPCTSLSLAGKQEGMTEGSKTSSSLLWEVKRILNECNDLNALPQVLLMENVTQVHNKKNMPEFQKWLDFLESIGYKNHWQDLNAKDFGVPQNRNRCYMISTLGDFDYEFPEPIPLTNVMKDYLEDSVDEKYYIKNERADLLIEKLILNGALPRENTL